MRKLIILNFVLFSIFNLNSANLSNGYKDIKSGMTKNQVSELLKKAVISDKKNDETLSIRIEPDTEILTYERLGYIKIGYFHFKNDKLFQIFIKFDEKKIDYYLLLKNNTEKFGKPPKLDPKSATWGSRDVAIVIEKPCTIKYLYLPIWNELIKTDQTPDDLIQKTRNDFIKDL